MTPERWEQIVDVLERARQLAQEQRTEFLDSACSADDSLRGEVESRLAVDDGITSSFLQRPPSLHLVKGTRFGEYEIQSILGAGGMGEVYRARDLRLRRDVAIKVLPALASFDPDRLRRFEQEATAAAALNHPNILAVFQMGSYEGAPYLVSELLEGETLREEIERGRIATHKAIEQGAQIAHGLAAAHEKGIVHRDLKPENVFVTKDGRAKILDFGLAKLMQPQPSSAHSTSETGSETEPGVVMGTVGYMAPEQVRGQPVDARSDLFAFGAILYEMLAGKRAFQKPTQAETMCAILNEDPPRISNLTPSMPQALQRVVHRCLEKNPEQRFHSASDLAFALEALTASDSLASGLDPHEIGCEIVTPSSPDMGRTIVPTTGSARLWRWITLPLNRRLTITALTSSILLVCLGTVWRLWQRDYFWHNPLDGAKVERLTDFDGDELDAAISEDGKLAIFSSERSGRPEVWLTQIGTGYFANITNGGVPRLIFGNSTIRRVGFSGDGSQVWATEQVSTSPIKERTWIGPEIAGVFHPFLEEGLEPAWSPDGTRIVYHTPDAGDPIFIADRNGNNPRRIFGQKPGIHSHFLTWSPEGRYIYFVAGTPTTEEMDIWRIPASTTSQPPIPERITHHDARVAYLGWLDSRTLIYSATAEDGSGQWLYAMDVEHRIPHRLSSGIDDQYLSVSISEVRPHRLIATVAHPSATLWTVPVSDRIQPETSAARFPITNVRALGPRLGLGYLLFLSGRGDGDGLWRFENGSARELWKGSTGGLTAPPAIAPDSGQICFSYRKDGQTRLNIMSANGTNVQTLAPSLDVRGGVSWSPDGKWIAVGADGGDGTHVFKIPVYGGEPVKLLDTLSYNPVWSPSGNMIVYSEQQGGSRFVLKAVKPDKAPVAISDISVVYTKGISYRFLPGQDALITLEGDFRKQDFYRVDLRTGEHRRLTDLEPGFQILNFDISSDGKQIVFDRSRDNADVVVMDLTK